MMSIFSDMVEDTIEDFMDDFFVVGDSFERCLNNLSEVLKRYEECNLVLNWKKCHFMVKEVLVSTPIIISHERFFKNYTYVVQSAGQRL